MALWGGGVYFGKSFPIKVVLVTPHCFMNSFAQDVPKRNNFMSQQNISYLPFRIAQEIETFTQDSSVRVLKKKYMYKPSTSSFRNLKSIQMHET